MDSTQYPRQIREKHAEGEMTLEPSKVGVLIVSILSGNSAGRSQVKARNVGAWSTGECMLACTHGTLHYITLHSLTLPYITLPYITLHLHCIALHRIALRSIT